MVEFDMGTEKTRRMKLHPVDCFVVELTIERDLIENAKYGQVVMIGLGDTGRLQEVSSLPIQSS